ncbi:MAG: hypothetical protein J1F28_08890 [Oscillospiraceae bacterium]|nr:hypothetical protein [Oscillospiraceae bacterium]
MPIIAVKCSMRGVIVNETQSVISYRFAEDTERRNHMTRKIVSVPEFFEKNNRLLIKFGNSVLKKLSDEALITALAEKDPEKLAKVFKLIFELMGENTQSGSADSLTELIGIYRDLGKEDDNEDI